MPSIGARCKTDNLMVITRVHGPNESFLLKPEDLLDELKKLLSPFDSRINLSALETAPMAIAQSILNYAYHKDSDNVVWAECEILSTDGISHSNVADVADYVEQ